jgi:hypothetical protein
VPPNLEGAYEAPVKGNSDSVSLRGLRAGILCCCAGPHSGTDLWHSQLATVGVSLSQTPH